MKHTLKIIFIIVGINISFYAFSQTDSTFVDDNNLVKTDSLNVINDTIVNKNPVVRNDTIKPPVTKKGEPIDAVILYECTDSMMLSMKDQLIFLYGSGHISTTGIDLKSERIEIDMESDELYAYGTRDTATNLPVGKPLFSEGQQEFTAGTMRYNFETKNGIVTDVMTEQGDGFLHGDSTKLHGNQEIHIKHGKYTTCETENPHFYVYLTKAKVIPKDKIITGPFNFVVADVPLPIMLPFGFFPNNETHSSGIIIPSYKDELERGFGLVGGGYYFALSDYYDLEVIGDVFTKGSFGVQLNSNFKKKYKYNGSTKLHYSHIVNGEPVLNDSEVSNTFNIMINYNQDPKARPTSNFSINTNIIKGNHRKYNSTNINDFVNSTTSSSASYRKTFRGTPFNMSVSANSTQNLQDSTINLQFPTIAFNMRKLYIFKSLKKPAKNVWYEKIGVSVSTNFQNKVFTQDSLLFNINENNNSELLFEKMQYGFKYDAPISTSFKIMKWINVSPSLNTHGRIYPNHIEKKYFENTDSLITDTVSGFNHNFDFSFSLPLSTKIYGMFQINRGRFVALRHVFSPSVGYSYRPDFSKQFLYILGHSYAEDPSDSTGQTLYSIHKNGIFGKAPKGEQQNINFGLSNNFELKLKNKNDTIDDPIKIKLLDQLSINSSYNFAADSLNLNRFSIKASTRLNKNTSINFSSSLDPYTLDTLGRRINTFEVTANNNIARFENARLTMNTSYSSKEWAEFINGKSSKPESDKPEKSDNPYDYYDASWTIRANYSLSYDRKFITATQEYETTVNQTINGSFSFIPTKKWKVAVSSGYDLDAMKLTSTTINMSRDLHCWEMTLMVTPYGQMKSYLFNIRIKSSVFSGVEYKRQTSWHDNF